MNLCQIVLKVNLSVSQFYKTRFEFLKNDYLCYSTEDEVLKLLHKIVEVLMHLKVVVDMWHFYQPQNLIY